MADTINIRLSDTFGCNVASTVVLQSLRDKFPKHKINVYTKYPDLILGLKEVDNIMDLNKQNLENYDVDFEDYLRTRKPQESTPLRHLIIHMMEIAESQLKIKLKRKFRPKINLTNKELKTAQNIIISLSSGKPIIWLQTKTREEKKDMPISFWKTLRSSKPNWNFLDLSSAGYDRRISIAITKFCDAGITLDTFLLHGSYAVGARNVVAIMVSSHKEVVTYPNNIVINGSKSDWKKTLLQIIRKLDKTL